MSYLEKVIEEKIHELLILKTNFDKNPYRNYRRITLLNKLVQAKTIYNKIIELITTNEFKLTESKLNINIKLSRNLYYEINQLIASKLKNIEDNFKFRSVVKGVIFCLRIKNLTIQKQAMASIIEIIKVVTSLVPIYDGKGEKLENIIAALEACKPLINDANRQAAIQTILSRLENKARAAVTDNPASIDIIINKLKEKCTVKVAPDTILAKINATRQNGNFDNFATTIEKLTIDLEKAYLGDEVPLDTATKLANNAGIRGLTNGIKNEQTKLLLKAGQFTTISKAIEKASELEAENNLNRSPSILHYSSNPGPGSRNHQQNRQNNQRPKQQSTQNWSNQNWSHQRSTQNWTNQRPMQNWSNNQRQNWSNQQPRFTNNYQRHNNQNYRPNNNGYNGNNRNRGPNVYFLTPENQLVPQQVPVGGQQQNTQTQNIQQQQQPQQQPHFQVASANMHQQR